MNDEFDEWMERYRPIPNPNGDSGFMVNDECFAWETYESDFEEVKRAYEKNPGSVWTAVDGDDGELYLGNGLHYVNRVFYFITEVPHDGESVSIKIN